MNDIEKVINGLKHCTTSLGCFECPYSELDERTIECQLYLDRDAHELLKDQKERIDSLEKAIAEKQKHLENLQKVNEELEERIAIMSDDGWHFSGTPELPGDALYVYVIVWTGYGRTYPLEYCKRNVRGKYVFRYEWINGDIYRGGEIKAWRYFPEPPKEGESK